LSLVALEPVVDSHLAAAKLSGNGHRSSFLGFEQHSLAAQAETMRLAVLGRVFQSGPFFGGDSNKGDFRHDAYSLSYFRTTTYIQLTIIL